MPDTLILRTPAKINLSLDITGKRADGYHTLRSVFQAIDLYDTLTFTKTDPTKPLRLSCNLPYIPCDARNLVWKAAARLLGDQPCGLHIHLEKRIPAQAGMGGGSSDCAAALLGVRALMGLSVTDAALHEIAASLGADVPFFLCGGTALAEGIGEQLTPLPPMPERVVVMAKGRAGVSTPEGYRRLDALAEPLKPDTDAVLAHLQDADATELFAVCGNFFDAVTDLPEVTRIRRVMQEHGVKPVLSGSGAAVFGGCRDAKQAEACADALRQSGLPFVEICRTAAHGVLGLS